MSADLQFQSYDLILCLGVLAHVDSPTNVIARIVSLLQPNGSVIVQNFDFHHPVGYLFDRYSTLRNVLLRTPYTLNRLSVAELVEMFGNQGRQLFAAYRYNMPAPEAARLS